MSGNGINGTASAGMPVWIGTLALWVGVPVVVLAMFSVAGVFSVLDRQMWMDEIHSGEIIADSDVSHAMTALRHGADFNPPGYYLLARGLLGPDATLRSLRLLSLGCVVLGLIAVGLILRRFAPFNVTALALLGVWIQMVVFDQAVEARFYAPWFCCVAWMAWCLAVDRITPLRIVSASILAACACVLHYFGIISVALMCGVRWLAVYKRPRHVWNVIPVACGIVALLPCIPFLLGQRSALTSATWISAPGFSSTLRFLRETVPLDVLAIALPVWWIIRIAAQARPRVDGYTEWDDWRRVDCAALAGLMLLPFALIAFSLVVQPAMVARYAMVGMAGYALLIAMLFRNAKREVVCAAFAVLALLGIWKFATQAHRLKQLDASRLALIDDLRKHAANAPVVFEDRIDYFPVMRLADDSVDNWFLLDFDAPDLREESNLRIVQRDVGRRFQQYYGRYRLLELSELESAEKFYVVPYFDRATDDVNYGEAAKVRRVADRVFELTRRSPRPRIAGNVEDR